MAKTQIVLAPNLQDDGPRRRFLPILAMMILVPLSLPLVVDGVVSCYARWMNMLDRPVEVRTPTFDFIGETAASIASTTMFHLSSFFMRLPWNPGTVLPVAAVIMGLAMLLLRK